MEADSDRHAALVRAQAARHRHSRDAEAVGALGYQAVELENAFGKSGAEWKGGWMPPS